MSLLHEIQEAIVDDQCELGPIFLKLRLLAGLLGGESLEKWVDHESEGYPDDVEVPSYRVTPVVYIGDFSGSFGRIMQNVTIPPFILKSVCNRDMNTCESRQSIVAIDDLIKTHAEKKFITIDASNLIALVGDKVYQNYSCYAALGQISVSEFVNIQHVVRNRVLSLTIEIEKSIPAAAEVSFSQSKRPEQATSNIVNQVASQVVYGNVHQEQKVVISVGAGDTSALSTCLAKAGLEKDVADKLAEIAASEKPDSSAEPFGPRMKQWLAQNAHNAISGAWKISATTFWKTLNEALIKYYYG